MKKFLAAVFVTAALLMTGCGLNDVQRIGTIRYENVTEKAFAEAQKKLAASNHQNFDAEYIFFDNTNAMVTALQSGQIDCMSTYESVANYISTRNHIEVEELEPAPVDAFCCAMREEDVALKKEFDAAISKIAEDGTLAKLVKTYINDSTRSDTPKVVCMPEFYNSSMIKVGVTGDLPMLDYIRPDGKPAGFNTAVLAEISKRIGKNFILVQVDSGARAVALSSKKVDVIFWAVSPETDGILPRDFDKPDGVILTVPYFSDKIVHVKLRK